MTKILARTPLAIALAAVTLAATPAMAETVAFELRIVHSDLDLTQDEDVKTMQQRIRSEVRKACAFPASDPNAGLVDTACRQNTTREAMAKLEAKLEQKRQFAAL